LSVRRALAVPPRRRACWLVRSWAQIDNGRQVLPMCDGWEMCRTYRDRQDLPGQLTGTGNASYNLPGQAMHPTYRYLPGQLTGTTYRDNLPGQLTGTLTGTTYRDRQCIGRLTGTGNASAERSLRSRDRPTGPSHLPGQLTGTGNDLPGQAMHRPSVRYGLATARPDLLSPGGRLRWGSYHRFVSEASSCGPAAPASLLAGALVGSNRQRSASPTDV
jgi:hypothetical protein